MLRVLDVPEIAECLTELRLWTVENGKLRREFVFGDFVSARYWSCRNVSRAIFH
jgi:hypothetical protein